MKNAPEFAPDTWYGVAMCVGAVRTGLAALAERN